MPYRDPERKREWDRKHRPGRSASFFAWRDADRENRRTPPIGVSERLATGGEEAGIAWGEYEAGLGLGNPEQDQEILRRIRRR